MGKPPPRKPKWIPGVEKIDVLPLREDRCPNCKNPTALKVSERFRELLTVLLDTVGAQAIEGPALTFQCRWCKHIRAIDINDLLGGTT